MWGWGLNWIDVVLFVVFYSIGGFGIGVGFHRHLTHGSFKAKRWLHIALAVAGSVAIEGSPTQWVADHRRHHQFSDVEGDPHSPWRYGETVLGPGQGPLVRPRRLAVPPRDVQPRALRARPDGRQGHPAGRPAVPLDRGGSLLLPALHRRAGHLVLHGRAVRVLLGRPGPDRRCCTTSPGRSTRSATSTASARSTAATRPRTSGRWRSCPSARTGTTCTTPIRPAPGTACCAARST